MAKYKKRKDGRYYTSVTIGRTEEGKRKLKFFYGTTIRELEAKLTEFKSLKNKGIIISDIKMTLAEWSEKWLKTYKQGVAYNTYQMYRNCVETHIITADIAKLPLNKIKTVDLQNLINDKQLSGLTRIPGILVLTLRQIFNQAIENDLLFKNPAKGIKKPSHKSKPKRPLSIFENKAIEKAELSDRERAFIYLGKYAGLRRGEILALTKGDIDIKGRTVNVNKTVVFKVNKGEISNMPKSAAGFRTIPMPNILYDFIKNYLKTIDSLFLFTTQDFEICTKSSLHKMWVSISRKLNMAAGGTSNISPISDLTPHILRHDYATSLYKANVDIKTAQKLLGHSDIKMTLQIYTHLEQDNKDITSKLNNLFSNDNKPSDSQMIVKI